MIIKVKVTATVKKIIEVEVDESLNEDERDEFARDTANELFTLDADEGESYEQTTEIIEL